MPEITDEELATLRAQAEAGASAAAALDKSQQDLAAAYQQGADALAGALRTANPDIPADAITGATLADVTASATRARSIADHAVAQAQAASPTAPTAPTTTAGAGQRSADEPPEGVDGARRIAWALAHRTPGS